jgi:hypothetical protein
MYKFTFYMAARLAFNYRDTRCSFNWKPVSIPFVCMDKTFFVRKCTIPYNGRGVLRVYRTGSVQTGRHRVGMPSVLGSPLLPYRLMISNINDNENQCDSDLFANAKMIRKSNGLSN